MQQALSQALQRRHHTTDCEDTRQSPRRTSGSGQLRGRQAGALPLAILPEAVPHHEVQVAWGRGEAGWSVGGGGQLVTRRKLEGGNLWGQLFNPQANNPSSAAIRLRCILESQLKCGITRLAAGLTCQLQPCPAAQRAAHQLPQVLGSAVPPKPAHQPVGLVLHTAKRGREGRRHAGCGF